MILQALQISKKYYRPTKTSSHFEAVKSLDLEVPSGKITTIMGRSGSGKSTLLYMMAGLLRPSSGSVKWDDSDLYTLDDETLSKLRNQKSSVIPQGQTGLFALSVLENVTLPAMLYGDSARVEGKAKDLLERVGIGHLQDARISELSGGELRRMAIARALVMDSQILFADEPTDDLDDENTENVLKLLRSVADEGRGVLLVTHEDAAISYSDSIFKMDAGNLTKIR